MGWMHENIIWRLVGRKELARAYVSSEFNHVKAAEIVGLSTPQYYRAIKSKKIADSHLLREALANGAAVLGAQIYSKLNIMLEKQVPPTLEGRLQLATKYADTDDLVGGLTGAQTDFCKSGFSVVAKKTEDSEKIKEFNKRHLIKGLLTSFFDNCVATDNVVVLVRGSGASASITCLSPHLMKILPTHTTDKNGRPEFRAFYKLPEDMRIYLRNLARSGDSSAIRNIPAKFIEAAQKGGGYNPAPHDKNYPRGYIELKAADKERVYVLNLKELRDQMISPSMTSVFASIALRQLLQDGEVSIAYVVKSFIHQIKLGVKTTGGSTIKDILVAPKITDTDKSAVIDRYAETVDKAMLEVTDQNYEHVFHFPGADVDLNVKFDTPDARIRWWGRTAKGLLSDSKGGNAAGTVMYLKGYKARISHWRDVAEAFMEDLYKDMLGIDDVEFEWDNHYLKESKILLEEARLLADRGADMETWAKILGYSYQMITEEKDKVLEPELRAKKDGEGSHEYHRAIQTPIFEPRQGMLVPGGRPENDGDQIDNEGGPRQERPSEIGSPKVTIVPLADEEPSAD